jgi:DNA-binding NtrC family response regulator
MNPIATHLPQPEEPCTVLAVNLSEEDRSSAAGILSNSYWQVLFVADCTNAYRIAEVTPSPIILCTPQMADGSWNELMEGVRKLRHRSEVVVASKFADDHLWSEVLNLGGYDVLRTPFDSSELLRTLFLAWVASKRETPETMGSLRKASSRETQPQVKKFAACS